MRVAALAPIWLMRGACMWLTDPRTIAVLTGLSLAVLSAFSIWPGLDLSVTHWFYDGAGFPIEGYPGIEPLRLALWDATIVMVFAAFALGAVSGFLRRPLLGLRPPLWGFIVFLFLLGPGLLVNGLLKQFWGRARPSNTVNFGGTAQFTPPYQITDQCASNCSFVSGEVAGSAAFTISLLLILAVNRARLPSWCFWLGQTLAIALLLFTMWQRVAVGRHFLSDALLAALFVALLAAILARVMRLKLPAVTAK